MARGTLDVPSSELSLTYSKPCDALQHGLNFEGLLRNRACSSCSCPPEYFLMEV